MAAAIAAVAMLAAKPGAGTYHLMPFVPIALMVAARVLVAVPVGALLTREAMAIGSAFLAALASVAAYQQYDFIRTVAPGEARAIRDDLRDTASTLSGRTIAVGYGGTFRPSFERVWPVFWGHPYLIDAPAVTEYQLSGLGLPDATYDAIRRCAIDVWLIPKDAKPFDVPNGYFLSRYTPLFDERFRETFVRAYAPVRQTTYFDVWTCRAHQGGAT
jgi:hypothetical protein